MSIYSQRPPGPTGTDASAAIPAMPPGVRVVTLDNGLTIILREDHCAPVVSAQAWCKAGSIHEGRWIGAGMSHVLEHMLFKGTQMRGPSRIDQEVQEAGGYMNAQTSFNYTLYYINVPNTGAQVAVDILCDIVQHATLPAEEMTKEQQVILREMDMNQDDPGRRSGRRLFETAYTVSPYRYTIIGYPDIYNEVRREDVLTYYREQYTPNNLFFVIVGDMNAGDIERQIRLAFAHAKSRPLPPAVLPAEPRQIAPREMIEEANIELGHLHFAWHIPDVRHPDMPALDVLATLLGNGRSSRLYQQVREKTGLAQSVDAWTYSPGQAGLLGMSAVVEADKFTATRQAMLAEIERMKQEPVLADELSKAVKQFTAGFLATRKTMQGQAQDLGGNWLSAGDLNFSARYLAAVKRLTPADLQRVARQYLADENQTLYALLPEGAAPKVVAVASARTEQPIHKQVLANGLRLLIKEDHRLPFVEFRVVFKGGVLTESPVDNGVTLLFSKLLLKGTTSKTAEELARQIESIGGSLDTYGGNNSFGVNAEVLSGDFDTGLEVVADVLLHPALPAAALDLERQMQLAEIRALRDQMLQSGARLMRQTLFGATGYGQDIHGSETSLAQIHVATLQARHQRMVNPNNAVLAIFGDVKTETVIAEVERVLGAWQSGSEVVLTAPSIPHTGVRRVSETRDKKQAVLLLGFPGVTLYNPDRFALELVQESCSDLGSRLFLRIREKLGLAYYVGAQNFVGLAPGYFAFYAGTSPEKIELVEQEMLKEADLLRTEGLTADELKRSKAKLIGQKKIARQDLGALALSSALDELYGLGYANSDTEDAKFEAVTLEQTQAVAQKYLQADTLVIASVKPDPALDPTKLVD